MTEKPEALRLADELDGMPVNEFYEALGDEAAAELRRLLAENESLRQIVQDFPPVEAELAEVSDRAHRLETQRDALLAALKRAEPLLIGPILLQARAAIKAVEEA